MAVNLIRNCKVFFTTNVDSSGYVNTGVEGLGTPTSKTITAAVWSDPKDEILFTTSTAHGLIAGAYVVVTGVTPATFNGSYTVKAINTTNTAQFTVAKATTPGSYTSGGAAVFSENLKARVVHISGATTTQSGNYYYRKYTVSGSYQPATYGSAVVVAGLDAGYNASTSVYSADTTSFTIRSTTGTVGSSVDVDGYANIALYAHTASTTREILVQDGFSFSQATQSDTIQLNEAGPVPLRGSRQFNTAVDPAEFSFTTYIRPYNTGNATSDGVVTADEKVLWNALMSNTSIGDYKAWALGDILSFTRVNTSTNRVTINFASLSLDTLAEYGLPSLGTVFTIRNLDTSSEGTSSEWNGPVKLVSIGTNQIVVDYLTAPTTATSITGTTSLVRFAKGAWSDGEDVAMAHLGTSDSHRLQEFGLIIIMDGLTYVIDKCVLDQASIDFGLDQIASVSWTGKGTRIKQYEKAILALDTESTDASIEYGSGLAGVVNRANNAANFLANKLTTAKLKNNIGGYSTDPMNVALGRTFFMPITGGNITIANNATYLTPQILGVVNKPIAYFTGSRSITGNITAYLRSGTTVDPTDGLTKYNSGTLIDELYGSGGNNTTGSPTVDSKYYLELHVGGVSNATKVHFDMNAITLQLPQINSESVMSLNIAFTAQGSKPVITSNADFDIENTNELQVRYYSPKLFTAF